MKIAVIGAGAVGGYFGGRLALNGNDVVFVVRGKTLEALRAGPLRVDSIDGNFEVRVRATDNPAEVGAVDVVLVGVKTWQLPEAATALTAGIAGGDGALRPVLEVGIGEGLGAGLGADLRRFGAPELQQLGGPDRGDGDLRLEVAGRLGRLQAVLRQLGDVGRRRDLLFGADGDELVGSLRVD